MRIGLAINNFDPKKGGAERYAFDLSTNLVKRGHAVSVFCTSGVSLPGVTLVKVNTVKYPRWLRSLSFALSHRRVVKTRNLDVMLGFGNVFEADVYQSHGGVQRVWMEREIASYDDPRERQVKAFLLKSSLNQKIQEWVQEYPIRTGKYKRIVAISDMIKGHMARHFGLGEKVFHVVYNGVNTERFKPGEKKGPESTTRFLFSAGNFRLKGLSPLLLAVAKLSKERKDFHLSVLGRGRKERYVQIIESLAISNHVTFLGETAGPELVYKESHVCVHPTFYDACSLTTMEAMASGLPTITTRWNGASALVSPEEGYVIDDARDVDSLLSAMRGVMNEDQRGRMGKCARLKLEEYTIERNAAEMEKILIEAAHG